MIDEPIVQTKDVSFGNIIDANPGKMIMIIELTNDPRQITINAWRVGSDKIWPTNLFGVFKEFGSDRPFYIRKAGERDITQDEADSEWVNGEEFIAYLREGYPDYLEWFLFHPEWLQ